LVSHSWSSIGSHFVILYAYNVSYPSGLTTTQYFQDTAVFYVNADNATPVSPYTNWATAATTIQDALDAAYPGSIVLVSNVVYQTGGHIVSGATTSRAALTKALALVSVNGPAVTTIMGGSRTRCAYLASGASITGFTLSGGSTPNTSNQYDGIGGGFWASDPSAIVTGCIITGNSAAGYGGGAFGGTLVNCLVINNSAGRGQGGRNLYQRLEQLHGCAELGIDRRWDSLGGSIQLHYL
jgi:hypothetical protein